MMSSIASKIGRHNRRMSKGSDPLLINLLYTINLLKKYFIGACSITELIFCI